MDKDKNQESNDSSSHEDLYYYKLLFPQAVVGFVDAVSFMVVGPSVVFYIMDELGGTKEQYGAVLASFSLASFLFKPLLGYWCDYRSENVRGGFRAPYLCSMAAAMMGGLVYFLAAGVGSTRAAVATVLAGRLLGGVGAASSTLAFTYIAEVVPHDKMTQFTTLLSMMRVMGMALAPGFNLFLKDATGFSLLGVQVSPYNSVGLFLLFANSLSFGAIFFLLSEPEIDEKSTDATSATSGEGLGQYCTSIFRPAILLPIIAVLSLNTNFQFLETGLAPAASAILDWDPVNISLAFSANAVIMFILMMLTFQLARAGCSDVFLLTIGLVVSVVGYGGVYFFWDLSATPWTFVVPFFVSTGAFPFLGSPTRSLFTSAVDADPVLRQQQGTMQAIMSMTASVAGFCAPGLIAAFVLRSPDEMNGSADHRVFSSWALVAPVSSLSLLIGFLMLTPRKDEREERMSNVSEQSPLVPASETTCESTATPEVCRRHTITLMGIPTMDDDNIGSPGRRMSTFQM